MIKGFRTTLVASMIAVLGVLQGLDWMTLITNPQTAGWVVAGLAVVMGALRAVTDTQIWKSY